MDIMAFFNYSFQSLLNLLSVYAIYWSPVVFGLLFWKIWMYYIQSDNIAKMKWVLLEIHLPKEIYKSPQAMEFVLLALDQARPGSPYEKYWKGHVPPWFSLEIVSIEGTIRFFIRTQLFYKDMVESRIYSQFPDVELSETPDYTQFFILPDTPDVSLYGMEYKLTKPDPIPIRTYIDYGMDKAFLDEKQRLDPMTPMIEFLGSLGPGEQVWIQILVQSHKKRYKDEKGKIDDWRAEAKAEIKKLKEGEKGETSDTDEEPAKIPHLSKTQNDNIASIERNMGKVGLDCGIRSMYLTEPGKFKIGHIPNLGGMFKQFNSADLNGFKGTRAVGFDAPWEDVDRFLGIHRLGRIRRQLFDAYRRRSYFHYPYKRKPFVLTVEELATIFHLPGAIAETPTLKRIEAKKSEPPINLPM